MKIMVIDGQGGGIGAAIIKGIRENLGDALEILALGTNSIATSRMMKAGANRGGTGENAIVSSSRKADIIAGPLGILITDAMMGEVTAAIAAAVGSCSARKILIPLTQEPVKVVGVSGDPLPHLVLKVVEMIREVQADV
ncbi:conserved hypothetical protein [uncultured Desulfatiglans sp.]|nr:conserved hypothetical protein [uncultured Desulfatiglans sp.]